MPVLRNFTPRGLVFLTLTTAQAQGCGAAVPQAFDAPATTPAASSVAGPSPAKPGPEPRAALTDPQGAALERLLSEKWVTKKDRYSTLRIPLPDGKNWKRIRLWGQPTRATFRYGKDQYAMDLTVYTKSDGLAEPERCLAKFMEESVGKARAYGARLGQSQLFQTWQKLGSEQRPMLVRVFEGSLEGFTGSEDYVGAIAAYTSWPGTCLVRAFAVIATKHPELAVQVRDRWVREGSLNLAWDKKVKETPPTLAR